jgi:putative endonuclease
VSEQDASFYFMQFHVYVLHAPNFDKIYIGFSSNVDARILSHNTLATKGWTIKFRPWLLVYTESFPSKPEAMKRERELKSAKGRDFIRKNILKQ